MFESLRLQGHRPAQPALPRSDHQLLHQPGRSRRLRRARQTGRFRRGRIDGRSRRAAGRPRESVVDDRLRKALLVLKKELINAQLQSKLSRDVDSKIAKRERDVLPHGAAQGHQEGLGMNPRKE